MTIYLDGVATPVSKIPVGNLRQVLPIIYRAHRWARKGLNDSNNGGDWEAFFAEAEQGITDGLVVIAAATGIAEDELAQIPAKVMEIAFAIEVIGIKCEALVPTNPKDVSLGEQTGETSTGTNTGENPTA